MLRSLKELVGYELQARDGNAGSVHDFLFSNDDWQIRYLVVDTGPWILGRKVIISPVALGQPIWASKIFPVDLTRDQIKVSPEVNLTKPISRQYEEKLHNHYRWAEYWGMATAISGNPNYIPPQMIGDAEILIDDKEEEFHLRSTQELIGYQVNAIEGKVGSVTDFIVEDEVWNIRYMVIDLSKWLDAKKKVLVALEWIESIDVPEKEVAINIKQGELESSPAYDSHQPVNRQYEEVINDYYGRPKRSEVTE